MSGLGVGGSRSRDHGWWWWLGVFSYVLSTLSVLLISEYIKIQSDPVGLLLFISFFDLFPFVFFPGCGKFCLLSLCLSISATSRNPRFRYRYSRFIYIYIYITFSFAAIIFFFRRGFSFPRGPSFVYVVAFSIINN